MIKSNKIQKLIKSMKGHAEVQETIHYYFPSRLRIPGWAYPLEYIQVGIWSHLHNIRAGYTDFHQDNSGMFVSASEVFRKSGSPVYVVERDCLAALSRTKCPEDIHLSELAWPFDGFLLCLPKSSLKAGDEYISHIIVAKDVGEGGKPMFKLAAATESTSTYNFADYFEDFNLKEAMSREIRVDGTSGDITGEGETATSELKVVVSVSLACLLLMNSSPEEIYYDPDPRKPKKRKRDPRQWVNPRYLGRTYMRPRRVALTPSDKARGVRSGDKVERHWKCGHFRHQQVGPKSKNQRRLIWIRPYQAGGKTDESN